MCAKLITLILSVLTLLVETPANRYKRSGKDAEGSSWNSNAFWRNECKEEHQPVVEYYYLNGLQYLFFSQRVTWEEAGMLCKNYNGRLAVLDKKEKAESIAEAIASSNIVMEDTWLGGRRSAHTWSWIIDNNVLWKNKEISLVPDVDDFPPWSRRPSRTSKECLAIDRRAHAQPNFIDLDCRLQRPFICEKKPEEAVKKPVPSKWVRVNKSTYTLYHARVTWQEAVLYCRSIGARLAILKNPSVVETLANAMTKTRPDFEAVWIGAHYSNGEWVWIATGASLNSLKDENGYPPWQYEKPEKNKGCLLLDRHIENSAAFVETACDRKRDFVCEEYPEDDEEEWLSEPVKFIYEDSMYIIYPTEKTWEESRTFCLEQGSVLAYVNDLNATILIAEAMGDHPKEISHVWIGGLLYEKTNEWQWAHSGRRIATQKDSNGFPPWANINERLDFYADNSKCLNLDRSDHVKPHLYGLDCSNRQPFVCRITCDVEPPVRNGNWICEEKSHARDCRIVCDKGYIAMGVRNVSCANHSGWATSRNWLEVPLCLEIRNYARRMIRSLSNELQKSAGYYIIFDHGDEKMRVLGLTFIERILNAFPVSNRLKMGLTCLVTNPPIHLSFNQTDTCYVLDSIHALTRRLNRKNERLEINMDVLYQDLWAYRGRKTVIFTIIDSQRGQQYSDLLKRMKMIGQQVVVIGLENDSEFLLPLASTTDDRRKSIYLFNVLEFKKLIKELFKTKRVTQCPARQTNDTDRYQTPILKETGDIAFRMFETANLTMIKNQNGTQDTNISSIVLSNSSSENNGGIIKSSVSVSTSSVSTVQREEDNRKSTPVKNETHSQPPKLVDDFSQIYANEEPEKTIKDRITEESAPQTAANGTNESKPSMDSQESAINVAESSKIATSNTFNSST